MVGGSNERMHKRTNKIGLHIVVGCSQFECICTFERVHRVVTVQESNQNRFLPPSLSISLSADAILTRPRTSEVPQNRRAKPFEIIFFFTFHLWSRFVDFAHSKHSRFAPILSAVASQQIVPLRICCCYLSGWLALAE